ncbi:MAG TPA: hypothetical protein VGT03_16345 [Candidatus Acidoferrales bacterium]|nr:hypothetical protein [Candidatus Acidoferrales bacterium]
MKKWLLGSLLASIVGAALFYSPRIGFNGQIGIECPLCPHVMALGNPYVLYGELTLIGIILNSVVFLPVGFVLAKFTGWIKRSLSK